MRVNMNSMIIKLISVGLVLSSCSVFSTKNESISSNSFPKKVGVMKKVINSRITLGEKNSNNKILSVKRAKPQEIRVNRNRSSPSSLLTSSNHRRVESHIQIQSSPQLKRILVQTRPLSMEAISKRELELTQQKKIFENLQSAYDQAIAKDFLVAYGEIKDISNLDTSLAIQAHYLAGLFFYATNAYGPSIQSFDFMLTVPNLSSSDRVKALFGKAKTYKKMNIPEQSARLYQEIIAQHPTSHEANRSVVELHKIRSQF